MIVDTIRRVVRIDQGSVSISMFDPSNRRENIYFYIILNRPFLAFCLLPITTTLLIKIENLITRLSSQHFWIGLMLTHAWIIFVQSKICILLARNPV